MQASRRSVIVFVIVLLSFGMVVVTAGVPARGQSGTGEAKITCTATSDGGPPGPRAPSSVIPPLYGNIRVACATTYDFPPALPGQQFLSFTATEVDITISPPGGTPGPFGLKFVTVPALAPSAGSFVIPGERPLPCATWSGTPVDVVTPVTFTLKDGTASVRIIRTTNVRANTQAIGQLNASPPSPFTVFQLQISTGCESATLRIDPEIRVDDPIRVDNPIEFTSMIARDLVTPPSITMYFLMRPDRRQDAPGPAPTPAPVQPIAPPPTPTKDKDVSVGVLIVTFEEKKPAAPLGPANPTAPISLPIKDKDF